MSSTTKIMVGNPIQIYNSQNGKRKLCAESFTGVLEKIPRGCRVAVVSLNGNARKGKSFMLNFFIKYLQSECSTNWFSKIFENHNRSLDGFVWSGGAERKTAGIWIWSEPFYVQSEGERVAVILMDTQGTFDDKTSLAENSLIFFISITLSSTFIYNIKDDLAADSLQFLEYFANTSANLQAEITAPGTIFQDLVLLIRDWQWPTNYTYGLHSGGDDARPEKNYMQDFCHGTSLHSDQGNLQLRQQILSRFTSTSAFLMPHPGLAVSTNTSAILPELDKIEDSFKDTLKDLMPTLFLRLVKPKKIYGQVQTRENLVEFIAALSEYISTCKGTIEELSNGSNLSELVAKAHLSSQVRQVESSLHEALLIIAAEGLPPEDFAEILNIVISEHVADFEDVCTSKFPKFKDQFVRMLKEHLETASPDQYMAFNNSKRLELEQRDRIKAMKAQGERLARNIHEHNESIQWQQQSLENLELQMAADRTDVENEMRRLLEARDKLIQDQEALNQSHANQVARAQQLIAIRDFRFEKLCQIT